MEKEKSKRSGSRKEYKPKQRKYVEPLKYTEEEENKSNDEIQSLFATTTGSIEEDWTIDNKYPNVISTTPTSTNELLETPVAEKENERNIRGRKKSEKKFPKFIPPKPKPEFTSFIESLELPENLGDSDDAWLWTNDSIDPPEEHFTFHPAPRNNPPQRRQRNQNQRNNHNNQRNNSRNNRHFPDIEPEFFTTTTTTTSSQSPSQEDLDAQLAKQLQEEFDRESRNSAPVLNPADFQNETFLALMLEMEELRRQRSQRRTEPHPPMFRNFTNSRRGGRFPFMPMRYVDPDNMSYEELLALEEEIGEVKSKGATKAQIKNLPISTFEGESSDLRCTICLVDVEKGEKLKSLPCLHKYHCECIDQWLTQKRTCPMCLKSIVAEDD